MFIDSVYSSIRGDNVICGDFDGDGIKEFAVGCVSNNSDLLQYYELRVYKAIGNTFQLIDVVDINGYKSYTETSTRAGNIDNDNKDEVLINTGTYFYILKFNNTLNHFEPVYFMENINTVNQIVYDFDGNGINEIGLNTVNDTLFFYEKNIAFTGPATPGNISAYSIDSNLVQINFAPVPPAAYYKIYRADTDSNQNFVLYDSVFTTQFNDVNVINRKNYYYKISAVVTAGGYQESYLSGINKVYVHNKARLVSAQSENNGYISVRLSQPIQSVIPNMNSFVLQGVGFPSNIAIKNTYEYLLIYNNRLPNGNYSVKAVGLRDFYNSPVDSTPVSFTALQVDSAKFYIKNISLINSAKLKVEFSSNVDSSSAFNFANYNIAPFDIGVTGVEFDANHSIVYLTLQNKAFIGATGKTYILAVKNVLSTNGTKIVDGAGGSFGLIFNKEDLKDAYVYPNPWSASLGQDYVTFAGLTVTANIKIFAMDGTFIGEIDEKDGNGGVEWDLKDRRGLPVASGIYIFKATGKNSQGVDIEEKIGKFVVVR